MCLGCSNYLENEKNEEEIIAIIDGEKISKKYFDSITANKVYNLKMKSVQEKIVDIIIEKEALIKNISAYELIKSFSSPTVDSFIEIELKRNNYNQIVNIDSFQANSIYKTAEYRVKKAVLGEKMINRKSVEIFLQKEFHQSFSGELYSSYLLPPNDNVDKNIVVISNYECIYCYDFHKKMKPVIEKNNEGLNFKFVYFGDQILKFANAPIAAGEQNKFNEMNDFVFEKIQDGTINDSIIFEFSKELNLNLEKFKRDYFSTETYKKLETNREIIRLNNIHSTPTLIIENKIYDEINLLDILKRKINEEK